MPNNCQNILTIKGPEEDLKKFEEKSEKSVPKPKRKPKPPMKKKAGGYMKKMKKGGKVGKYSCSHNRLY